MRRLISHAIHRRELMFAAFGVIAVIGWFCWRGLSIDAYPDIADVTVQVVTQVPGLAAEEIEQQITIPVERALSGIPSMKVMRSKNTFGLSTVIVVFDDGVDDYWARQLIQARLAELELPYDAAPELNPLTSPTGEIYRYVLTGPRELRELTDLHKWVVIPRLKQVAGVADVSNFGGITTQFQIELDPVKLQQYGLALTDITEKIEANNASAGGSMLMHGDLSYVVRGIGLVENLDDLGRIVVKTEGGVPVYLSDVGTLKYGNLERKGVFGFRDGEGHDRADCVEGIVQMLRGENPSEVLEELKKAVAELNESTLPDGVRLEPFMDRTQLVDTTLNTVSHTLFEGMVLVVVVLIIYLGSWRGALLVAATIPLSLLIAFILMKMTGIPANLLSLGAIDFGILVDGAIVMMETILRKREQDPDAPLEQDNIIKRASDVARPIFFSTLIIIVAYLPLFAFEHIERKMFTPMAYTVGYALAGALLVALLLIPGIAYLVYRKPQKVRRNRMVERMTAAYERQLLRLMQRPRRLVWPLAVIVAAAGVLCVTVGKDFLPPLDEGSIWIQVQLPAGISLERSTEIGDELRERLGKFEEVSYVMTQVGRDDEGAEAFSLSHVEVGIGLKPYGQWTSGRDKAQLIEAMDAELKNIPGITVGFSQPIIDMVMDQVAGAHSDLALKVYGENNDSTRHVAEAIERVLATIPGAVDVAVDQEPPMPQLQIIIDRDRIARYGLNVSDVTDLIELVVGGKAVSSIFVGSKSYDVICRYNESYRDTPEKIGALRLTTPDGGSVPLSQVAEVRMTTGASMITREMNRRNIIVRVNLRGVDLSKFLAEARKRIDSEVDYDRDNITLEWGGQFENQSRAYERLAIVVPLALAVMLLLLIVALGKIRMSLAIFAMLPLALFGGMLALNLRGMTLNVSSAVGFIALFGVAIQNGVIMLSHINNLRRRRDASTLAKTVAEGAAHRFRPILMTASVAVLGLLPASLSTNIGSDVQRPLATVIVYGLLFATALTLYVLPVLYYAIEKRYLTKQK
ncbi:MAG: CusA/CzcA family heavy metal efflux RND transporter [Muribaculaceae bacterium]|nr:CusA/CzcA family heavy metal efflux RND transporter [Muribaculaceae bacterium]